MATKDNSLFIPDESEYGINDSLNGFFNPDLNLENAGELAQARTAFINLVGIFIGDTCPELITFVRFDYTAIHLMLKRVHRDAYGVCKFSKYIENLAIESSIKTEIATEITKHLKLLSIRINSESPRKTRIAAAFSLWMSTFRPVNLDYRAIDIVPSDKLEFFCARLNYWIATSFLCQFGDVSIPKNQNGKILLERVIYDFTYRDVGLSSLEALYANIFIKKS